MDANLRKSGVSLFQLGQLLGLAPPTHGYTVAEKSPEIVTAPGVYFPVKKGKVIPLESRQEGGSVKKVGRKTMLENMLDEKNYMPDSNLPSQEPQESSVQESSTREPLVDKQLNPPPGSFMAPEWTGPRPWRRESSWSYEGNDLTKARGNIVSEKKKILLVPRQGGGKVDPSLFTETYSLGERNPVGDEQARTNILSQIADTSGQSFVAAPASVLEGNPSQSTISLAPTTQPEDSTGRGGLVGQTNTLDAYDFNKAAEKAGLSGMSAYEASAERMRGSSSPPSRLNLQDIRPLSSFTPPKFRENRQSPVFGADQKVAYDRKYKPYFDLLRTMEGQISLIPRAAGGATDPSMTEEELRRFREAFPDTISSHTTVGSDIPTTASRVASVATSIPQPELLSSRGPVTTPTARPGLDTFLITDKATPIPKSVAMPNETAVPQGPEAEGTFTSTPMTQDESRKALERLEASPRNLTNFSTERPGYKERFGDLTIERPADYRSYYEAHPEERIADAARQETKPLVDTYTKLIEDARTRAQGFGLGQDPKTARLLQTASAAAVPEFSRSLEKLTTEREGLGEKYFNDILGGGTRITPHLVKTAGGQYVYSIPPRGVTPPGIVPAGIEGETPDKTPLPSTEKGWTVSYKNGMNWASKMGADGKLVEEPYDPATHGQAIQTTISRQETMEREGILSDEETNWIASKLANKEMIPSQIRDFGGFGRVGQINRGKIVKAIKRDHPEYNFAFIDLTYTGDKTEINKNKMLQAQVLSFEKTAIQNAKQVDALSRRIGVSRIPILNEVILAGKTLVGGTPIEAQYIAAWRTLVNEYARIATSVTGGGITSDTARREIEAVLRKGYTPEQVQAVARQLVLEMEHRRYGFEKGLYDVMSHWGMKPEFEPKLPTAADIEGIFSSETPIVGAAGTETPAVTTMTEQAARDALKAKGIEGTEQDRYIEKYKKARKVQ